MDTCAYGIAIIAEGETEAVFYEEFLRWACDSLGRNCSDIDVLDYRVDGSRGTLVRIHVVGSVSQMTNSETWFYRSCRDKYPELEWTALLAYDTDGYNAPVSKFHEGDWLRLRHEVGKAATVIDLAAVADIEDIMLCDYIGVMKYLSLPLDTPVPCGGKGKSKMKKLFKKKEAFTHYHEGERARPLIQALDFNVLMDRSPIPLREFYNLLRR